MQPLSDRPTRPGVRFPLPSWSETIPRWARKKFFRCVEAASLATNARRTSSSSKRPNCLALRWKNSTRPTGAAAGESVQRGSIDTSRAPSCFRDLFQLLQECIVTGAVPQKYLDLQQEVRRFISRHREKSPELGGGRKRPDRKTLDWQRLLVDHRYVGRTVPRKCWGLQSGARRLRGNHSCR